MGASRQLRLGLIGCGFVAEMQARALSMVPAFKITGLVDSQLERTTALKEKMKLEECGCFQDYRELLAVHDLDAVSISVPNHLHKEVLIAAAEAGKHVICEKPIANSLKDADEMIAVMDERHLKFGVYHEAGFYPENMLIREVLGSVATDTAKFAWLGAVANGKWNLTPWRLDPAFSGGGVMMDEGIHLCHLAKVYFGQKPDSVSGFIDRLGDERCLIEDTSVMTFQFPAGLAQAVTSLMPMIGRHQNMRTYSQGIITDKVGIELIFGDAAEGVYSPVRSVVVTSTSGATEYAMPFYPDPLEKNIDAFKRLFLNFADSISQDGIPHVDGKSSRDALEMVLAAYESAALGRAIQLPLQPTSPLFQDGVLGLKKLDGQIDPNSMLRKKGLYGLCRS